MLLRPANSGEYNVVGYCCYIHGLMDGEALLGPLPNQWELQWRHAGTGYRVPHFKNTSTNHVTLDDPRLPPLDLPWERAKPPSDESEEYTQQWFRNKDTGEVVSYDPRVLPTVEARGGELVDFMLV
jgi:hypothetical protein